MPHATAPHRRRPPWGVLLVCLALALVGVLPATAAGAEPVEPPAPTRLTLTAPGAVVDGRTAALALTWVLASTGQPVAGGQVRFEQRVGTRWRLVASRTTAADGTAVLSVRPRTDSAWRARGVAGPTWTAALSVVRRIDNRPPGAPVSLPGAAPRPRGLPAQPRATGEGAQARVTPVPNAVWRSMVGRSWRQGCPVGRPGLRLLRVNYYGFDGYRYRGEVVVNAAIARKAAGAFSAMHAQRLPIRRMYRVDRFGYSKRVDGGDDHASMRADNTSGFNCRWVVNRPGVRSPHATGRSIDVNPFENPYHSATGWVPNRWWASRSHHRVAWRSAAHPVITVWRRHGFRWTYGAADAQHWDGRQGPPTRGSFTG